MHYVQRTVEWIVVQCVFVYFRSFLRGTYTTHVLRLRDTEAGVFSLCRFNNLLLAHTYILGHIAWITRREKVWKYPSKIWSVYLVRVHLHVWVKCGKHFHQISSPGNALAGRTRNLPLLVSPFEVHTMPFLTLGAHVLWGLQYLSCVCVCVCLSVCHAGLICGLELVDV